MADKSDIVDKIRRSFTCKDCNLCEKPLAAYILPHDDEHMSEYLAEADKHVQFVSGFSGSSGTIVITMKAALLWTDGRYFLQAVEELGTPFKLQKIEGPTSITPGEWLANNLNSGDCVGAEPALFSCTQWLKIKDELETNAIELVALKHSVVNNVWSEKPMRPLNDVISVDPRYSGRLASEKFDDVIKVMTGKKVDLHIISELDNIAWILNSRGNDIPYNPVFFGFIIIHLVHNENRVFLYIDLRKITTEITTHFEREGLAIQLRDYREVYGDIEKLAQDGNTKKVWISTTTNYKIMSLIPEKKRYLEASIVTKLKAVKNATEVEGMKNSHVRDGYALTSFLYWLEKSVGEGATITEVGAATMLEKFRSQEEGFRGLSFPTISSVGEHAAIIHYTPSQQTDAVITDDKIYLVDSGGQYWDGTTDVTRTVHFGVPTEFQRETFTRVLKGVIALNTAVFPENIKGNVLDSFARRALWDVGLQYSHGTGHGIGSHLCVHEGPIGVSWRPLPNDPGILENMFISNEPGYYKDEEFGVRIENIEWIHAIDPKYATSHKFLTFKTITMCPIQTKLIDTALLTNEEIQWVNRYHDEVREVLVPIAKRRGNDSLKNWIIQETSAIKKTVPR